MASIQPTQTPVAYAHEPTVESAIEHAKRAFALKKFEQAVEHYATALELITKQVEEDSPEIADLYFSYGKALLENAISQNSVLGKDEPGEAQEDEAPGSSTNGNGPILSFSGDAEDNDEDPAVDLFAQSIADAGNAEEERDDEDGEDVEPEDDFNAAWEILDLARAIYDKQKDEDDEIRLKLADTYITLGDVSLETEKFEQAIMDYEAGLSLKSNLLPLSSRHIAEAHYKLSMVLDLAPGRLSEAIVHAEKALESVESRLAELRDGLNGQLPHLSPEVKPDLKGKKRSIGTRLVRDDLVQNMSKAQIEAEVQELSGLREDLGLKVEELKTTPNESVKASAPTLAAEALDKELNVAPSAPAQAVINDLTSMVVKKKKKAPVELDTAVAAKRKADTDAESSSIEKKARRDTPNC